MYPISLLCLCRASVLPVTLMTATLIFVGHSRRNSNCLTFYSFSTCWRYADIRFVFQDAGLQPYLDQINVIEEQVAALEQAAYKLDAYSKKLGNYFYFCFDHLRFVSVLAWAYLCAPCAWSTCGGQKRASGPLELELLSCHVDAQNWTCILSKNIKST